MSEPHDNGATPAVARHSNGHPDRGTPSDRSAAARPTSEVGSPPTAVRDKLVSEVGSSLVVRDPGDVHGERSATICGSPMDFGIVTEKATEQSQLVRGPTCDVRSGLHLPGELSQAGGGQRHGGRVSVVRSSAGTTVTSSFSADPSVPSGRRLWNNTPSPVVLFRGTKSAPCSLDRDASLVGGSVESVDHAPAVDDLESEDEDGIAGPVFLRAGHEFYVDHGTSLHQSQTMLTSHNVTYEDGPVSSRGQALFSNVSNADKTSKRFESNVNYSSKDDCVSLRGRDHRDDRELIEYSKFIESGHRDVGTEAMMRVSRQNAVCWASASGGNANSVTINSRRGGKPDCVARDSNRSALAVYEAEQMFQNVELVGGDIVVADNEHRENMRRETCRGVRLSPRSVQRQHSSTIASSMQAAVENQHHHYVTSDPCVSHAYHNEGVWRVADQLYQARRSAVPVSADHSLNSTETGVLAKSRFRHSINSHAVPLLRIQPEAHCLHEPSRGHKASNYGNGFDVGYTTSDGHSKYNASLNSRLELPVSNGDQWNVKRHGCGNSRQLNNENTASGHVYEESGVYTRVSPLYNDSQGISSKSRYATSHSSDDVRCSTCHVNVCSTSPVARQHDRVRRDSSVERHRGVGSSESGPREIIQAEKTLRAANCGVVRQNHGRTVQTGGVHRCRTPPVQLHGMSAVQRGAMSEGMSGCSSQACNCRESRSAVAIDRDVRGHVPTVDHSVVSVVTQPAGSVHCGDRRGIRFQDDLVTDNLAQSVPRHVGGSSVRCYGGHESVLAGHSSLNEFNEPRCIGGREDNVYRGCDDHENYRLSSQASTVTDILDRRRTTGSTFIDHRCICRNDSAPGFTCTAMNAYHEACQLRSADVTAEISI
jgi:hypothetical protein